jgi:hypothetical protein
MNLWISQKGNHLIVSDEDGIVRARKPRSGDPADYARLFKFLEQRATKAKSKGERS